MTNNVSIYLKNRIRPIKCQASKEKINDLFLSLNENEFVIWGEMIILKSDEVRYILIEPVKKSAKTS